MSSPTVSPSHAARVGAAQASGGLGGAQRSWALRERSRSYVPDLNYSSDASFPITARIPRAIEVIL